MFGSRCRRFQLLLVPSFVDYSVAHFHCIQNSRWYASKSLGSGIEDDKPQDGKDRSFTISYLINSCGLSPEVALSLSNKHKRVFLNTRQGPDSVLNLLKHNGFNDTQISQLVRQQPSLLAFNAQKTLVPKLEFLGSIGISGTVLARLLCINPRLLGLSLEKSLRPYYDISKTLRVPKEKLHYFFTSLRGNSFRVLSIVTRNIQVLRAHGVPESSFPLWQPLYFTALSFDSDKVEANVNKVISMGFHPSDATFMKALYVISVMDASKWEQKMEFYNKWGLTEDDVLMAFRKSPLFMSFSEKNISSKLDFYLNKMGCQPADVARCPDVLTFSLDKRIIPRCSVIRLLQLKGIIVKKEHIYSPMVSIKTILQKSDKWFMERFVIKYQEQVPELFSIFQGKMGPAKFGLGFDKRGGLKQL